MCQNYYAVHILSNLFKHTSKYKYFALLQFFLVYSLILIFSETNSVPNTANVYMRATFSVLVY
jgi:hypothetical protein